MPIAENELERMHKRFPYPRFSDAEYERRYRNIRAMMKKTNLDCLPVAGGSAAYGRLWFNFRYSHLQAGQDVYLACAVS